MDLFEELRKHHRNRCPIFISSPFFADQEVMLVLL